MPDLKISQMPAADALAGTEALPVVQGGENKHSTPAAIKTFVGDAAPTGEGQNDGLMTHEDKAKLDGIEAGADVTDAANVAAAGAVMTADVDDTPVDGATTAPISSNWAFDHGASTQAHGVSGTVVGTSDTQTLTNKTITNYKEGRYATTTSADITLNLANGNVQRLILDANRQITLPADPGDVGQSFVLIIECATFTPTWNSSPTIEWLTADGLAPTLVTTANLVNVLTFMWDDTDSRWLGFLAGKES